MICGRITAVVENLDVELASRSKAALIDISIVLPKRVHILVARVRRTRRYCKSSAQIQLYLHSISDKTFGSLHLCSPTPSTSSHSSSTRCKASFQPGRSLSVSLRRHTRAPAFPQHSPFCQLLASQDIVLPEGAAHVCLNQFIFAS
jgi:hypothetical protein